MFQDWKSILPQKVDNKNVEETEEDERKDYENKNKFSVWYNMILKNLISNLFPHIKPGFKLIQFLRNWSDIKKDCFQFSWIYLHFLS